jgi:Ca2+-binding EF-hand superfamily protein
MGAKFSTVEFESKQCYSKWSIANVEAAWQRHEALQDPTAPKLTISAMDFRTVFSDFEVIIGGTFLSLPGSEFDLLKSASRQCFTLEVFGLLCVLAEGERKDSMEDRVKMLLHIFDSDRDGTLSESEILLLWGSLISAFQKVGAIETSQTSQDDMRKLAEWLVRSVDLDGDGILSVEELVMWCAKGGGKHIADVVALVLTKDGKDRNKILAKKGKKSGKSSPKNGKSSPDAGAPGGGAGGGHGHSGGGHGSPRGGASMSGQRVKPAAHVSRMQSSEDDLTQVRAEALAVKIKALERDTGAKPSKEDYLRLNKEVAAEEHHRLEAVFKTSDFGSLDVELDIHDILQIRFGFAHMANKSGVLTRPLLFRVLKHRFPNINACGREAIIRCGPLPSPHPSPLHPHPHPHPDPHHNPNRNPNAKVRRDHRRGQGRHRGLPRIRAGAEQDAARQHPRESGDPVRAVRHGRRPADVLGRAVCAAVRNVIGSQQQDGVVGLDAAGAPAYFVA